MKTLFDDDFLIEQRPQNLEATPNSTPSLSTVEKRLIEANVDIHMNQSDKVDFLHTVLCQVGMPRSKVQGRVFERKSGSASMVLEAGRLFRGGEWIDMPLPYGTRPRLVMVHISGEAIRTKSRKIDIGESVAGFLRKLDISLNGGPRGGYTMFRTQMEALAACRMSLGINLAGRDVTVNTNPISRFEAWVRNQDNLQGSFWPGVLELSQEFFETLTSHAVPLDSRALAAIQHSCLALDIYTWLAHRLCRIESSQGMRISWNKLQEQFGQEYKSIKDFKKNFQKTLSQVVSVYPDAKIESVTGGLLLKPSPPPIKKFQSFLSSKDNLVDISRD